MTSKANPIIDSDSDLEQVIAITAVFAASLMSVSAIEWLTWLVANSSLPTTWELMLVYRGGWLFLPAAVWIGWLARPLPNRILVLCAAYATCFIAIMEFRGVWPWHGTFEAYQTSSCDWTIPAAVSLIVAVAMSYLARQSPVKESTSYGLLGVVAVTALVQLFMSKSDTDSFVSLRWLFRFIFLAIVGFLHTFVRMRT